MQTLCVSLFLSLFSLCLSLSVPILNRYSLVTKLSEGLHNPSLEEIYFLKPRKTFSWVVAYMAENLRYSNLIKPHLTYSQTKNFRLSKLKEFAKDNFKFDKNGRKFSKMVENAGNGKNARSDQIFLFQ